MQEERVVEPSEIIIETGRSQKENHSHANPWVRLLARGVDYSLFFLLLLISRKLFQGRLPFGEYEALVPFEYFVWIPFETLLLRYWGKTPGKFFLKTSLKAGKKEKLDFGLALKRSFAVWLRGMGMGIPVVNVFCLLVAYNKLKWFQITSWDQEDHIKVTHYPIGRWRIYVAVVIALTGTLYYYSEKNKELTSLSAAHQR